MNTLQYYLDKDNDILSAYEKSTEFFVQYVAKNKSWQYSRISFSEYQHSYNYEKVGREFALKYTDSNLPDNMFNQYKQIIINNRNGLEK